MRVSDHADDSYMAPRRVYFNGRVGLPASLRSRSKVFMLALLVSCFFMAACEDREVRIVYNREARVHFSTIRAGVGPPVKAGRTVQVRYIGSLSTGEVFMNSYEWDKPHEWTIGDNTVIAGMDRAVTGMKLGEIRNVTLPPELHWGRKGYADKIPPNETVHFKIELVGVH